MVTSVKTAMFFVTLISLQRNDACCVKSIVHFIQKVIDDSDSAHYDEEKLTDIIIDDTNVDVRYWDTEWIETNESMKILFGHENELAPHWDIGVPLKVIIHGWRDSTEHEDGVFCIKDAYIAVGGYNVITVDWGMIADNSNYMLPVMMISKIAHRLSRILENIVALNMVHPNDIHLIGHSLGAHVAGLCGSSIKTAPIGRITGLDPARPGFEVGQVQNEGLKKEDAKFVDVIHTSGGSAGCFHSMGHADFFPNGGSPPQPGCYGGLRWTKLFGLVGCSHSRAYKLYENSIYQPMSLIGVQCTSWADYLNNKCDNNNTMEMGHGTLPEAKGDYYLITGNEPPFQLLEDKEDL